MCLVSYFISYPRGYVDLLNLHPYIFLPFADKYKKTPISMTHITLELSVPLLVSTPFED